MIVAVQASPEQQASLLELQQHDTSLMQLAHKRSSVPEIETVKVHEATLAALDLKIVAIKTEISDLSLAQKKAENDVEQVVERAKRDQERIDSSASTNAKELEVLQHEIDSLAKRRAELEDVELEIMLQLESAREAQSELLKEQEDIKAQFDEAVATRDAAFADIDHQMSTVTDQRNQVAKSVDAQLLALYDKIRIDSGGIGAALLHRGACQGCHIALDATEVDRIRHLDPDVVVRCEECRRILVRTSESGL